MSTIPECPNCQSPYVYEDGNLYVCPECANEWGINEVDEVFEVKDAHGNLLQEGDAVMVIKDLKVKGASAPLKVGTKIKSIRLNADSDHNIDCKVEGFGAIGIKSQFVKKA